MNVTENISMLEIIVKEICSFYGKNKYGYSRITGRLTKAHQYMFLHLTKREIFFSITNNEELKISIMNTDNYTVEYDHFKLNNPNMFYNIKKFIERHSYVGE